MLSMAVWMLSVDSPPLSISTQVVSARNCGRLSSGMGNGAATGSMLAGML